MSPESLPVKLRQARGAMTLAEAAHRSGVPEDRIRMYEEGDRQPYGKTLRRLARAYGITVSDWLGNDGGPRPPAAPRRPDEAARQRRRRPGGAPGHATVEIPVDFDGPEPVRIVVELVLRPNNGTARVSAAASDAGVSVGVGDEPAAAPTDGWDGPPRPSLGASPDREPARDARNDRTTRSRRRLAPHVAERLRGERVPHAAAADASALPDPLDEFRRAYSQFRQSRTTGRDRH